MARLARTTMLLFCTFLTGSALATTYYVDYSSGSDSNNGTSKTSPWKHAPGMQGCTGSCGAASPKPGDQFIFRGGVVWPAGVFQWQWQWSGASGSPVYLGVDSSWYAGGSWSRPILSGGGAAVGTNNRYLWITASYIILDNFEFTGFYYNASGGAYCTNDYICLNYDANNLEIKNNYFHGWTHGSYPASDDAGQCISGDTAWPSGNSNSSVHDNVFDGSDTTKDSMAAIHGGPETVYNNYIDNMSNGLVGEYTNVHDNVIQNINESYNPTQHENGLEINFSGNGTFYNNLIAHVNYGVTVWVCPQQGDTQYFFNNVLWDIPITNILDVGSNSCAPNGKGGTSVFYNNTVECGPDGGPSFICVANINVAAGSVTLENNHWVTNATSPNAGVWSSNGPTPAELSDIVMSYSTACNKQGYCSNEIYPFSPSSTSSGTVGKGTNLSSLCSSVPSLCSDTTLGVSYNVANHTTTYPARTPNTRPASGAWDVGAYLFSNSNGPLPPTQLAATVQ